MAVSEFVLYECEVIILMLSLGHITLTMDSITLGSFLFCALTRCQLKPKATGGANLLLLPVTPSLGKG